MDVSGVTAMASLGTSLKAEGIGLQLSMAVMKQIQDQQAQQAAALIQMIQQSASVAAAASGHVDIYA